MKQTLSGRLDALSPPFLKGDLGGFFGTYSITPDPLWKKGKNKPSFNRHINGETSHQGLV
jgi:hypothetical protein